MKGKFAKLEVLVLVFSAALAAAQNGAPPSPRPEPCWKQAGISPSVMEQHRGIERDAHSQVQSVCQNSSLAPQQKQQQVREIREQAQQKLNALLTSEQQSALHACQQQHAAYASSHTASRGRAANPCAYLGSSQGRQGPSGGTPQTPENSPQN